MRATLASQAARFQLSIEFVAGRGEAMPIADQSFDAIVATLVLCTVLDPVQMLREIERVLRPGGKYVFVEHVKAQPKTVCGLTQRLCGIPWKWLFEGCHLRRETDSPDRIRSFPECGLEVFPAASCADSVFTPYRWNCHPVTASGVDQIGP